MCRCVVNVWTLVPEAKIPIIVLAMCAVGQLGSVSSESRSNLLAASGIHVGARFVPP